MRRFKNHEDHEINLEEVAFDDLSEREMAYRELFTSKKTFFLVAAAAALLIFMVLVRVAMLNLREGELYRARASANVTREISTPTYRALIVDRFGEKLADNRSSFSVFLDITSLLKDPQKLESLSKNLPVILGLDEGEFLRIIKESDFEKSNWIYLAGGLTKKEVIEIKGLNEPALKTVDDYEREYIDAPVFAHLIGYTGVGEENKVAGKSGLELEYNELIRGREGRYVFYEDALGEVLDKKVLSEPEPSPAFETTIDAGLQRYFYKRLKSGLESLGRNSGAGLALNPRTGEVLALISLPSFDSGAFVDRKRNEERKMFLKDDAKPLFNRILSGVYSPGSAIKPLVALAALKENIVSPQTEIYSDGSLEIPNIYDPENPSVFVDWRAHGWVNLASALARSSNIYFYLLGGGLPKSVPFWELTKDHFNSLGLGVSKLNSYWKKFGFDLKTGIDLPFESSGFLPSAEEKEERTGDPWRLGDTYNISIGQGDLLVTPLQLLNFTASIGNGGKIYKPFLKKDSSPEVLIDYSDLEKEIKEVQKGLEDAVTKSYGTAFSLSGLPMSAAGKTGTPQIFGNKRVNAFFVGYAPADDPEIAILVLVENARDGSLNALPIAKDVFEWYYYNRILKDKSQ